MAYSPNDFYARKAKKESFVARSVYKLSEIDEKYKIIKSGDYVLDLGCSPGSWSQYCSIKIGLKGIVVGIDLTDMRLTLGNACFYTQDINTANFDELKQKSGVDKPFDVVISDMAPNTSGNKFTDQARSFDLCEMALGTAIKNLKKGGHFVCKFFDSQFFNEYRESLRIHFEKVDVLRPKSTRSESKEIFFVAKGFKGC
jgi:23S rRNA (uridine2552-2'-O)-methyltransferase